MDLPSLLLIIALAIPVAAFVLRPLLARSRSPASDGKEPWGEGSRRDALLAERERVLSILQELDFDHAAGKIPQEEYPARRAALVAEGAAVLKALDEAENVEEWIAPGTAFRDAEDREATLEALVASLRIAPANGKALAVYWTQCGMRAQLGDRFCSRCGHAFASTRSRE